MDIRITARMWREEMRGKEAGDDWTWKQVTRKGEN